MRARVRLSLVLVVCGTGVGLCVHAGVRLSLVGVVCGTGVALCL